MNYNEAMLHRFCFVCLPPEGCILHMRFLFFFFFFFFFFSSFFFLLAISLVQPAVTLVTLCLVAAERVLAARRSKHLVVCSPVNPVQPGRPLLPVPVKLVECPGARPQEKPPISRQGHAWHLVFIYYALTTYPYQLHNRLIYYNEHAHGYQNAIRPINMAQ